MSAVYQTHAKFWVNNVDEEDLVHANGAYVLFGETVKVHLDVIFYDLSQLHESFLLNCDEDILNLQNYHCKFGLNY